MSELGEKIKKAIGVEGDFKSVIKPMIDYNTANITLAGMTYPKNLYYSQFLTFVEGLSTKRAGQISLLSGIVEIVSNPVMGIVSDRTRSKYGRHRRYLLWMIPFLVVAYIMSWSSFGISAMGSENKTFVYYLAAALLYGVAYTMGSIPHTAMLPQLAPGYFERTQYKIIEYIMNSVGMISAFLFSGLALSGFNIKTALVGMPDPGPEHRSNYLLIGLVLCVWLSLPMIYCFFKTSEPSSLNEKKPERVSFGYLFNQYKMVFQNRSFRQYCLIYLFYMLAISLYATTDQYFLVSVAGKYNIFNLLQIIAGVAEASGAPLNYMLVKKFGKQFCGKLLGPLMVVGLLLNGLITPSTPSGLSTVLIIVSAVLYNFGFSGPGFVAANIQPDITDVDEMMTGERREGIISTFHSFFRKGVASVTSFLVNTSLHRFGYNTKVKEPHLQSAGALKGLRLNFVLLPAIAAAICVLVIYSYKMRKQDHEMIRRIVAEKHETGSVTLTDEEKQMCEKISGQKFEDMWIGKQTPVR